MRDSSVSTAGELDHASAEWGCDERAELARVAVETLLIAGLCCGCRYRCWRDDACAECFCRPIGLTGLTSHTGLSVAKEPCNSC